METHYICANCNEEFIPGSSGFGEYGCLIIDPYDDTEVHRFHMCQSCRNNLIKTFTEEKHSDLATQYENTALHFRKCAENYMKTAEKYEEYANTLRTSSLQSHD